MEYSCFTKYKDLCLCITKYKDKDLLKYADLLPAVYCKNKTCGILFLTALILSFKCKL